MATWYRTSWHDSYTMAEINPVEILKSTSAQVYVGNRRHPKRGDFQCYFETREEAVEFIKNALRKKRDYHAEQADRYDEAVERQF